jgi:hypothetical protein
MVNTFDATLVTKSISFSIFILNCPLVGKLDALLTVNVKSVSEIPLDNVLLALFANFSVAISKEKKKQIIVSYYMKKISQAGLTGVFLS